MTGASTPASDATARVRGALDPLALALAREGFNHVGVVDARAFAARHAEVAGFARDHPWARSIVVIGNGGRAMWSAFRTFRAENPGWMRRRDPLDDWCAARIETLVGDHMPSGARRELFYSFRPHAGEPVPFQRLAQEAGLGIPSKLGLLIHPTWGPWLGLRAAVATDLDLSPTASLGAWNPCEGCPAPCAGACHGAAVGPRGWDMRACVESKVSDDRCRGGCDARSACVVAPEHRYDDDEIRYHSTTSAQRIEERLGPYRKLTFGVVPSRFLLRMYFFTLGRIFSKVSK